jgi:RHS repeat-associated protein
VSQGNGNNEQLIARYGYDPFNRRIWKEQFGDKNGQSLAQAKRTYFFYSDEGLLAEEEQDITLNGDGSTIASGQPILTTQYGPRPESEFTTGILFVKTKNSNNEDTIAYYHHDHLNTPIQATGKAGNIVWSAMYHPFGNVTITTPVPTPEHLVIVSNLRLPGQYEDEETGLYYNFHRYYSPDEGRYVTADPIGLEGGWNLYAYVNADPLNLKDPRGEYGLPGAAMGAGLNFAGQMAICLAMGGNPSQCLKCVDFLDVVISGIGGALGPGLKNIAVGFFKYKKFSKSPTLAKKLFNDEWKRQRNVTVSTFVLKKITPPANIECDEDICDQFKLMHDLSGILF